jgi:hypothetical protein
MSKTPEKPEDDGPDSLHGMAPEDVIRQMFAAKPPAEPIYCPNCREQIIGLTLVGDEGEIRCPKCGTIATDERTQF